MQMQMQMQMQQHCSSIASSSVRSTNVRRDKAAQFHQEQRCPPRGSRSNSGTSADALSTGFYEIVDYAVKPRQAKLLRKLCESCHGEQIYRPHDTADHVDEAHRSSVIRCDFICWGNDIQRRRACIRAGSARTLRACMLDGIGKTGKKQIAIPGDGNAARSKSNVTRKRFLSLGGSSGDELGAPSRKGRGSSTMNPEWEPPFRKGSVDNLMANTHRKKHLATYKDLFASIGVSTAMDPRASLPTPIGKRQLPSYKDERLSYGVGAALQCKPYDPKQTIQVA